jgi:excisionase family DNA binding protein
MTPLLTTEDVARHLGVHEATVRRLVRDGVLRRILIGDRTVRFDFKDVAEYLESKKCLSSGPKAPASGATTLSSRAGNTAAPRGKRRGRPPKPLSARSDLRPLPVLVPTRET